jgi:phage baseplate assembly protein W
MKGFGYPFKIGSNGAPSEVRDEGVIASAMTQFFSQQKGERLYSRANGLSLQAYVFENEAEIVKANIRRDLMLGISRFEPRVEVLATLASYVVEDDQSSLQVTMVWRYRGKAYSVTRNQTV